MTGHGFGISKINSFPYMYVLGIYKPRMKLTNSKYPAVVLYELPQGTHEKYFIRIEPGTRGEVAF